MTATHKLHQHLTRTLTTRLESRRVVTWYDPRREFVSFVGELTGGDVPSSCSIDDITLGTQKASLCVLQESFFEVKFAVEAHTAGSLPDPLVIYIGGRKYDDQTSVLMELEAAGDRWEPQLKREARRVLQEHYGDGRIDQILESDNVSYNDIVALLESGGGGDGNGSLLNVIFKDAPQGDNAAIVAEWLADSSKDDEVVEKGADQELIQLIQSRLGLELDDSVPMEDARKMTLRYVLLAEFRDDLEGAPPDNLEMVSHPQTRSPLETGLKVVETLRNRHPEQYIFLANQVEEEFQLSNQAIEPVRLGGIDTFRFEERSLLEYCGQLIIDGNCEEAHSVIGLRKGSFWARNPIHRQEQWRAYQYACDLAIALVKIQAELPDSEQTAVKWIEGYTGEHGWYEADLLHRRMESTLSGMTDPIESETVIHRVRQDYEATLDQMASGFIKSFAASDWSIPGVLHQSQVYRQHVENPSETVCYLLVDALRFEMGVELRGLLESAEELHLEPAIAAIPTITPIGMAALMPEADQSFSVVQHNDDLGAKIGNSVAANLNDRRSFWNGRVPGVVDIELDKVLAQSNSKLKNRIGDAPLLVVRSLEIDAVGEGGNASIARRVMDTAIKDIARAVKRLASLGVSRFVIAADHGHLFIQERDESQRIESPGGDEVSLHRRCWAGRGGANPGATVRVQASQLGYDSDLDFVFPENTSVFKAGGDLAFHHGGLSLQELLVPVLTVRMPTDQPDDTSSDIDIKLTEVPEQVANRIVTFGITLEKKLFDTDAILIQPVLLSDGQHVGHAEMALEAELDNLTHCITIAPGSSCKVGIRLLDDDVESVQILVLDPDSQSVLTKSKKIPVRLGM